MEDTYDKSALMTLRMTGLLFLLCMLIPTLNWVIVLSPFQSYADILDKEFIFRVNIINQIVSAICIVLLGLQLHQILKIYHHRISSLALVLRLFEAGIFLVMAFLFLVAFSMLKNGVIELSVFRGLVKNYIPYTAVPGIFMGISMLLFSILFYVSSLIPKWLAIMGIASYAIVIIYDSAVVLDPNPGQIIQVVGSAPVGLYQIVIAFYFIFIKNKK